ncbi:MAG TPA: SIMPL domain-containing protein [Rhodocyclaceae bacterium]|nr:SIMPL domain-containing protein [Rhodocyclaceae bacterium]
MRNAVSLCVVLGLSSAAFAQTLPAPQNQGTLIDLSSEASRATANDLFRATAFAENSDPSSAAVARQTNQQIAAALAIAKTYPSIKVKTSGSYTTPIYGKTQKTIESWRMRSELQLESRDPAALADLIGKLQATLGISQLSASPAPETAQKAESEATVDALNSFRERASLIASTLGKKYKLKELVVSNSGRAPVYPMLRKAMLAEAAPMPMEAGESQVAVTVNGKIELID